MKEVSRRIFYYVSSIVLIPQILVFSILTFTEFKETLTFSIFEDYPFTSSII